LIPVQANQKPMSLFNELKRRNVFRVATAYVVAAWLILQVTDIILNNVEAPDWAFWLIVLILSIGLIFVVGFSWAFEMTPEGLKHEREVDRSSSITTQTGKKLDRLITGVLVVALAYFVIDKFVIQGLYLPATTEVATSESAAEAEPAAEPATGPQDDKSIAVLPFVNMSDDASNEFFSDGISEEILNALAKVRELKVAGRTSSFAFKGQNQDLRVIADTLGVQNILEGSVRKAGDTVRITAQLVKADDGFHLWSETYDRKLDDVFAIQDEIANAILLAMKATLLDEASSVVSATRTAAEAYELYLLAKQRMYERTEINLKSAAELLDRAIAIDETYAPAYAQRGIATLLLSETSYGTIPNDQANAQSRLYLDKALELDRNLAEAWAGLGLYYNGPPLQAEKSIEVLERALTLNPNLINAGNWLALVYMGTNRARDALDLLNKLSERDPLYKPAFGNRVGMMAWMGQTTEARAVIDDIEPFMPDDAQILQTRAWVDYAEGKHAAGLIRFKQALEKQPTDRVLRVGTNQGHYRLLEYDQVFDDNWSDLYPRALYHLGRIEEATLVAERYAADGSVSSLFRLLNQTDRSETLIKYLEARWPSLEAFQKDIAPSSFGYAEMADIALAYRRTGQQQRFEDAMTRLRTSCEKSLADGLTTSGLLMTAVTYHAMANERESALTRLAQAIDRGFVFSVRMAQDFPALRDLEGDPKFEAIQDRMIEHLNRERALLGLGPVSG
jgi:TolB-like protein/Tfp pilus assembly protein PilF